MLRYSALVLLCLSACDPGPDDAPPPSSCASQDGSFAEFEIDGEGSNARLAGGRISPDEGGRSCGWTRAAVNDLSPDIDVLAYKFDLYYQPEGENSVLSVEIDAEQALQGGEVFEIDERDIEASYSDFTTDPWRVWLATAGTVQVLAAGDDGYEIKFDGDFEPFDFGGWNAQGPITVSFHMLK